MCGGVWGQGCTCTPSSMSPWHIPWVAPPVWAWKTSPCARGTQPGIPLCWDSCGLKQLSPLYPNTNLEDINPAVTSSFPHKSQLGSRLGNKPQTTLVWCVIPPEDARATFPSTARGWECSAHPTDGSHLRRAQSCGFATGCHSHTPPWR